MAEISKQQLKKAILASLEYADQVTKPFAQFDKDQLYVGVNAIKEVIDEDPTLEKILGEDFNAFRQQLRFIAQNSGVHKNAQNAAKSGESMAALLDRLIPDGK